MLVAEQRVGVGRRGGERMGGALEELEGAGLSWSCRGMEDEAVHGPGGEGGDLGATAF